LKYILEFVVGIPPTGGHSCSVGDKPEIAGNLLTAPCSCFVGDKPELDGNPLYPLMTGYSYRVENKPEMVDTRLMAGSSFVGKSLLLKSSSFLTTLLLV
jgi:hypothetical protein